MVWPTRKETQKFFALTLCLLIAFGAYLFVASNIFSEIIFGLKDAAGTSTPTSAWSSLSDEEIDALFSNEVQIDAVSSSTWSETQTQSWASDDLQAVESGAQTWELSE